jgi:1-acyl-sn-glycerol-3-phosphate acyltransferase
LNGLLSTLRLLLLGIWTAATWLLRLLFWPIGSLSEPLDRRWRRAIMRCWGAGFTRITGIRVQVEGPRPRPPYYLVANHLGYLDIFLLATVLGCTFVSRGDVKHWPVMGWVARSLHVLFIDREQRKDAVRVNDQIAHTLAMGDGLVVFAESRISCGLAVAPFKSALIQPAIDNAVPIHHVTLNYQAPEGAPSPSHLIGWWRPEGFFLHVRRLLRYPGTVATLHFGPTPIPGTDRKQLATALHEAVAAPFVPWPPAGTVHRSTIDG